MEVANLDRSVLLRPKQFSVSFFLHIIMRPNLIISIQKRHALRRNNCYSPESTPPLHRDGIYVVFFMVFRIMILSIFYGQQEIVILWFVSSNNDHIECDHISPFNFLEIISPILRSRVSDKIKTTRTILIYNNITFCPWNAVRVQDITHSVTLFLLLLPFHLISGPRPINTCNGLNERQFLVIVAA